MMKLFELIVVLLLLAVLTHGQDTQTQTKSTEVWVKTEPLGWEKNTGFSAKYILRVKDDVFQIKFGDKHIEVESRTSKGACLVYKYPGMELPANNGSCPSFQVFVESALPKSGLPEEVVKTARTLTCK